MNVATKRAERKSDVSAFPLFFRKPAPLEFAHHAKAGLSVLQDYSYAKGVNSLIINTVEFAEAAKYYPIVFTQAAQPMAAVIVGLEKHNYFTDKKGQWLKGAYVPAYLRRYPFIFMEVPERKQFLLCVDEAAPQFSKKTGKNILPFYDSEGKPSELTRNALEFCAAYHNHSITMRRFCDDIAAAGLLAPSQSDIKLAKGRKIHLSGFQVLDEKKFHELPDETILEFHKKGWLPLIHFALMSASNWNKLADMANALE